jgi:hypothetical protein
LGDLGFIMFVPTAVKENSELREQLDGLRKDINELLDIARMEAEGAVAARKVGRGVMDEWLCVIALLEGLGPGQSVWLKQHHLRKTEQALQ